MQCSQHEQWKGNSSELLDGKEVMLYRYWCYLWPYTKENTVLDEDKEANTALKPQVKAKNDATQSHSQKWQDKENTESQKGLKLFHPRTRVKVTPSPPPLLMSLSSVAISLLPTPVLPDSCASVSADLRRLRLCGQMDWLSSYLASYQLRFWCRIEQFRSESLPMQRLCCDIETQDSLGGTAGSVYYRYTPWFYYSAQ